LEDKAQRRLITRDEVEATASLAAIEVSDADIERLTEALGVVLEHFSVIEKVELETTVPGTPVERRCGLDELRADVAAPERGGEAVAAAPDFEDDLFFVPRVSE